MDRDGLRNPSTIFFQHDNVRRSIISSYWIVIFLALPLWWKTTSIERLSLPSSEVYAQGDAQRQFQLPVRIALDSAFTQKDSSLLSTLQTRIRSGVGESALDIQVSTSGVAEEGAYVVLPSESQEAAIEGKKLFYPLEKASGTLAFTLLNEDSSGGQVVDSWDVLNAISHHITPLTSALSILHNFTIESQVQFYAPLAFEPQKISDDGTHGLTPEQLTVFINSAEWTLSSSSSNDPVLHFLLFVPSASRRPLRILNTEGVTTNSNSFLIPQWGGVVIANLPDTPPEVQLSVTDLKPVFSTFSQQLLTLLGVPRLPNGISTRHATQPTSWQIDTLLRHRTIENVARTSDTLRSTVSLVEQIPNMPVGEKVRNDVRDALKTLGGLSSSSSSLNLTGILQQSSRALTRSQKAFFHPGMLALLYFPAEHKYAVYTPLFASAIIPLVAAAMREVAAWRRQRREARTQAGQARQ
ncbi:GPI transamidase component [Marasmius crinis-equi]|uniref:GPI transamidase component n=1 Tax=Marasmius crinis-equi TaxID=585013 RepID=A0ABR3FBX6_9AGAR